jgi:hypothetical protein
VRVGRAALWSVVVLIAAFRFLAMLRSLPPPGTSAPTAAPTPAPTPTPLPDSYLGHVESLNRFRRAEGDGRYSVTYGFVDHHGRNHEMTCAIDRRTHEKSVAAFGYRKADVEAAARKRVRNWMERRLSERGLSDVLHGAVGADRVYHWHWELPEDLEERERARRRAEIEGFLKWLSGGAYDEAWKVAYGAAYHERGFKRTEHFIEIDYAGVVDRSVASLDDCFRSLEESGKGYTRRQELGLFLAFLQEIRYEIPPDEIDGRHVQGFYVPTEVLVNDHGDCDSKSAAFAALWRHLDTPLILVSVPRHMLVGVEVRPGPAEAFVRIGNHYFVLCEPAGPAKLHPGAHRLSGSFEYVLLDPGRSGGLEGAASTN